MLFPASLLASTEETKSNITKATIRRENKDTMTQNTDERTKIKFGQLL